MSSLLDYYWNQLGNRVGDAETSPSFSMIIDVDLSVCLACLVDVGFLEDFHDLLRVQVDVQLTEQKFKLV
jgi:hypothetical protein